MRITGGYEVLNRACHVQNQGWGRGGVQYAKFIRETFIEGEETPPRILDYGCGKGDLVRELDCDGYDPCFPRFFRRPVGPFGLVVCTDVLEHVEPECLDEVLADIRDYSSEYAFFSIGLVPAVKELPDGSNAHRIIENSGWWHNRLQSHFETVKLIDARRTTAEFLAWV